MLNYMLKIIVLLTVFLTVNLSLWSQQKDEIIQQRIELMAEQLETEAVSLEDVFDALYYYYDHPLNINQANYEELSSLFLLSDLQINELVTTRNKKGEYKSIYDLTALTLWSTYTLEQVAPFIVAIPDSTIKKRKKVGDFFKKGKTETYVRWMRGIERRAGYEPVHDSIKSQSNAYYWGSPDRLYNRVRYTVGREFSTGVTMEKDPGEALGGPTQPYGFDFYSAHLYYRADNSVLQTIAIGDYQLEIGQGIAMWTGYAFNKTNNASGVIRKARGVQPYTSADEQRFMRGAALQVGNQNLQLKGWYSSKMIDGSVEEILDTLDGEELFYASSITSTGLHRTTGELARKNNIREISYGSQLTANWNELKVGASFIHFDYDIPIQPLNRPMNTYAFSGDALSNLSFDYVYKRNHILFFGEVAQSRSSQAVAHINGLSWAIDRRLNLSFLHRNYPKDYHSVYNRGFGEYSRTVNEEGTYLGVQSKLSDKVLFNGYVDVFNRPWLSFRVDAPSNGHEYFAQLQYNFSRKIQLEARYRSQEKTINVSSSNQAMRPVEQFTQDVFRVNFRYKPITKIIWRTRFDYVVDQRESLGNRTGVHLGQDLTVSLSKHFKFTGGYSIFDTEDFDTRIFVYEHHLQNVFSVPVYFNQGSRLYGMIQYSFWENRAVVWVRYGTFVFANQSLIGVGPERIEGNRRSDIAVQLKIRW